jgi:superfamily II DNA or RNA helicase
MVIGDEAHFFKAKSLAAIMEKLIYASHRIGTTGTLDGTLTHKLVLEGLFGPVHRVTTTKELMDSNALSELEISVLLLKYSDDFCRAAKVLDYQQEIDFLVTHEPRNRFIRNLAMAQKGNTLILYNYVEKHGKPLYEAIRDKLKSIGSERKVFFVSGDVETDERERIRAITEKETDAIIVASMGTFSTGINIRNLHNIVFASPSKSQIRILQSIGRGLRKADNGQKTQVFDVADDLHWKKHRNYTLDHAAERIKIYGKEQFDYKIYEVPL